jgi:hypothetical protein
MTNLLVSPWCDGIIIRVVMASSYTLRILPVQEKVKNLIRLFPGFLIFYAVTVGRITSLS